MALNEMIPKTMHRSPGICLIAEENPGKLQLENSLMKGTCDQSMPQMENFLGTCPAHPNLLDLIILVGSQSTSGREMGIHTYIHTYIHHIL